MDFFILAYKEIQSDKDFRTSTKIVTGMHLSPEFGFDI